MWNQSRCNGTSERVTSRTGSYKACPNEAVTSLLCLHKRSVWNCPCLIWCCLSVLNYSEMASKLLVCAFIPASLFNARGRWLWALRCASLAVAPIPPGVLSQWGRSGSRSPGLWSRCCRGTAEVTVLGFTNRSVSGVRDGHSLISAFTWQVQCLVSGLGSTRCGFFRPIEEQTLQLFKFN